MLRQDVYAAIDSERDYADSLRSSGTFTETKLPVSGELLVIQEYIDKATKAYVSSPGETPLECLSILRKIAATAVRCMENYGVEKR